MGCSPFAVRARPFGAAGAEAREYFAFMQTVNDRGSEIARSFAARRASGRNEIRLDHSKPDINAAMAHKRAGARSCILTRCPCSPADRGGALPRDHCR